MFAERKVKKLQVNRAQPSLLPEEKLERIHRFETLLFHFQKAKCMATADTLQSLS